MYALEAAKIFHVGRVRLRSSLPSVLCAMLVEQRKTAKNGHGNDGVRTEGLLTVYDKWPTRRCSNCKLPPPTTAHGDLDRLDPCSLYSCLSL